MGRESISIDDLLAKQSAKPNLRVTIEPGPEDQPERVKVTPFLPEWGCQMRDRTTREEGRDRQCHDD
jgi:hypothetical protein